MWACVLFLKGLVYSFCKFIFLQLCQIAIFMFPDGLVPWLQKVRCYLHEVIGRRPRFGHHTEYETSEKPMCRSKYIFFKKKGVSFMHRMCLLLSKGGGIWIYTSVYRHITWRYHGFGFWLKIKQIFTKTCHTNLLVSQCM